MILEASIIWDDEAKVYVITNDELGIALEGGSIDALMQRFKYAAREMIELNSQDSEAVERKINFSMQKCEAIYG